MSFASAPLSDLTSNRTGHFSARKRSKRALPDLPQFYYHANFCDMLSSVDRLYGDILDPDAQSFLNGFAALPFPAQCAYVRMVGRKGFVFDSAKLSYPEIDRIAVQIKCLRESGFIRSIPKSHHTDYLSVLTKPELIAVMEQHLCKSAFKRSWKKDALIDVALAHINADDLTPPARFIMQGRRDTLRYLSYLYFGKIEDNLQPLTMRDLGLVKTRKYEGDITPRFDDSACAKAAYFYASALHDFRHGTDAQITTLIDSVKAWPKAACDISAAGRDKLLHKLGGLSERLSDVDTALSLYRLSDSPLCNERRIRLLYARNTGDDREAVKAELETLIDNPGSDGEHDFASDFYARKYQKKRTSQVTDMLRRATRIGLDDAHRAAPERAAKAYYNAQGYDTYRSENGPWRMLFGLLFWDMLFGDQAHIHSDFERMPTALKSGSFYDDNSKAIEERLSLIPDKKRLLLYLLKITTQYHGHGNAIFRWSSAMLDRVKVLINHADPDGLISIMRLTAQNYTATKDGYPDLMLLKDGTISFVEIKAEGDVIRRNQLTRFKQLRVAGFKVDIVCIDWIVDPNQIYVVVDIETTGGRAAGHRITEIGAVKMQGDHVIDEWQSLINPQRPIPEHITRLTGITDAMVADAPIFAEIADDFAAFMGDAIFVAHNVNFDYGFIKAEYGRLERHFRFPKLCTVASMRKLYSGHKSYSLKNLTQAYAIDLSSHHRALCDAKAAAELLVLVNAKRRDDLA
ncbi:exonuclease domain-containing protein [Fretibacter rubidus]|uniref:exonuclease domain-containing protein n=1 Tax=Fretibacter rubidus TaxID=570162 RepID=UPI003529EE41